MAEGLYVYCVIGTGEARNFGSIGVGGRGDVVTTIPYRDLSAVVSSAPLDRYVVGRESMLAHERVLEGVMGDHTLLPVRFYTMAPNAEEVRTLLRTRYYELRNLLRQMEDRVELGLKASWLDMGGLLRGLVAAQPLGDRSSPPSVSEVRSALDTRTAEVRERLMEALRPLAIDSRSNKLQGEDMILNAAFLVGRRQEPEFDSVVSRLSDRYAAEITFKYIGPAPPYSFVNIVIKDDVASCGPATKAR
ncbi:MAG: GvpL/GvpF family gas vesicle protein [Chloroflexota bacterium]